MIVLVCTGSNHYHKYGEICNEKTPQRNSFCTGLATVQACLRCYMISLSYRHKTKNLSPRSYACTRKCHPHVRKSIGLEVRIWTDDHTRVLFVEIAQTILHTHLSC